MADESADGWDEGNQSNVVDMFLCLHGKCCICRMILFDCGFIAFRSEGMVFVLYCAAGVWAIDRPSMERDFAGWPLLVISCSWVPAD